MSKDFIILDHPADIGLEIYGKSLADLFANAAKGLVSLITDIDSIECKAEKSIAIESSDSENLMVRWLSEILFLFDGEHFLVGKTQILKVNATSLNAKVYGELVVPNKHNFKKDIKAITYHQLKVWEDAREWKARVFVDI